MTTIKVREAVDTNVLIYSLDEFSPAKQIVAKQVLIDAPVISTQNLSELLNVLTKRWKYPKPKAIQTTATPLKTCR